MRIALVKQDVYQDLYVEAPRAGAARTLFSSLARVGPIGLLTLLDADFHIVHEDLAPECRSWEKNLPDLDPRWFRQLKDRVLADTDFPTRDRFIAGSPYPHSRFSKAAASVDWSAYDVVVSINFAIPAKVVARHPGVLWCYMNGEGNLFQDRAYFGYDVTLNQQTRGIVAAVPGPVDFPYTFVGPRCLEDIMLAELGRPSARHGAYLEVNSSGGRDASPAWAKFPETEQPLRHHQRAIRQNLAQLFDAKYFVKDKGRCIRGNSVIEAISAGALVLMSPNDLLHVQLLPPATWVESLEETSALIRRLDAAPDEYEHLRRLQRERLNAFVVEAPLRSLRNCLAAKRARLAQPPPPAPSLRRRLGLELRRALSQPWS